MDSQKKQQLSLLETVMINGGCASRTMSNPVSPKVTHLKLTPQQLPSTLKKPEIPPTGRSTHTILSVEDEEDEGDEAPRVPPPEV